MRIRKILPAFVLLPVLALSSFGQDPRPSYRDPSLPAEARARDLLSRMTLEEKVNQLAGGRRRALCQ